MANLLKSVGTKIMAFSRRHPIIRGMASYGVLWPTSCFIQQKIEGRTWETIDLNKCMKYSIYGSLISAPSLYWWIRLISVIWPQNTLKLAVVKAATDQIVFEPIYISMFFLIMSLWEGKTLEGAKEELFNKFWTTYIVSSCFWPLFQTINFAYVPERNRVVAISYASLGWVTFLAYIKHLQINNNKDILGSKQ